MHILLFCIFYYSSSGEEVLQKKISKKSPKNLQKLNQNWNKSFSRALLARSFFSEIVSVLGLNSTLGGIDSICFRFFFSKHCEYRSRGVKRPGILWEILKYSLPGGPSSQNWVKSKTICHFLRNFDEFLNGFWFYSILAGWLTWQWEFLNFSQNFGSFDTPDTSGCASAVIQNHCLKQIWAIPPTV